MAEPHVVQRLHALVDDLGRVLELPPGEQIRAASQVLGAHPRIRSSRLTPRQLEVQDMSRMILIALAAGEPIRSGRARRWVFDLISSTPGLAHPGSDPFPPPTSTARAEPGRGITPSSPPRSGPVSTWASPAPGLPRRSRLWLVSGGLMLVVLATGWAASGFRGLGERTEDQHNDPADEPGWRTAATSEAAPSSTTGGGASAGVAPPPTLPPSTDRVTAAPSSAIPRTRRPVTNTRSPAKPAPSSTALRAEPASPGTSTSTTSPPPTGPDAAPADSVPPAPTSAPTGGEPATTATAPTGIPLMSSAPPTDPLVVDDPADPGACHQNYSGCVPVASDVDCAGRGGDGPAFVTGPVTVHGEDVYGLDGDGDGVACEPR
ncbi:MAG: hypothetical protein ACK5PP_01175 [Acidimicrobiales bacterium]